MKVIITWFYWQLHSLVHALFLLFLNFTVIPLRVLQISILPFSSRDDDLGASPSNGTGYISQCPRDFDALLAFIDGTDQCLRYRIRPASYLFLAVHEKGLRKATGSTTGSSGWYRPVYGSSRNYSTVHKVSKINTVFSVSLSSSSLRLC